MLDTISAAAVLETGTGFSTMVPYRATAVSKQAAVTPPITFGVVHTV